MPDGKQTQKPASTESKELVLEDLRDAKAAQRDDVNVKGGDACRKVNKIE